MSVKKKSGWEKKAKGVKSGSKLDTKFGKVFVLERANGKIAVVMDGDITKTFSEKEFFKDFVL